MSRPTLFALVLLCFSLSLGSVLASDWPAFRGPNGGVSDEKDLPVKWTKENILWKVKLPGPGTASPITYGNKIFISAYTGYGTTITKGMSGKGGGGKGGGGKGDPDTGDQKKLKLVLLCLDSKTGETIWQKELAPKLPEASFSGYMREHGYASSTPVTDGERVYVFFGKSGVFAFDLDGKQLWQTSVGTSTDKWGSAASPVVYKDLVIVNAAIESRSLVALDKKTGKEVWRKGSIGTNWASPIIAETKDGKAELVLSLPSKVVGYDPLTGKELWTCQGIGDGGYGYTCSTPVTRDGIVYIIGGGGPTQPTALAVKIGGSGDVTKSQVLWRQKIGNNTASPVLSGNYLCWVAGSAVCLDIDTGKTVYNERLYGARNEYVSAVATADKIYALTRNDGLFVLTGGGKFEKLAHNEFSDDASIFNASPAISNGCLLIRSNGYLYCIGKK